MIDSNRLKVILCLSKLKLKVHFDFEFPFDSNLDIFIYLAFINLKVAYNTVYVLETLFYTSSNVSCQIRLTIIALP